MSEQQINNRRNWKAITLPYDEFLPDNTKECLYCLTENQAMALRGYLEPMAWDTRWYSNTQEIDKEAIKQYRDDIIRRLMMSCCDDEIPVQYRYTEDGTLQKSTDGGETWEDAPEFDPRNNSPIYPPMPPETSNLKCQAADSAVLLIKEQVGDQLTDDMSRYTLAQLIEDWVTTYIETSNPFQALMTIIANQIFALIIATLRPALTEGVYDNLRCILYCDMAEDASFNEAQWEQVRSDILDQITGIAGVFLEHLVYLVGKVGLTNLARSQAGSPDADCSGCGCGDGCDLSNWSVYPSEGDLYGHILSRNDETGEIVVESSNPSGGNYYVIIQTDNPATCCKYLDFMATSGDFIFGYGIECEGTFPVAPIGGLTCQWLIQLQSPAPFAGSIVFDLCE